MTIKTNFLTWVGGMFKEFVAESTTKPQYEIADIFECPKSGFIRAVIKLSSSHSVTKNISDIITDNDFIEGLDKKTIRTLTFMATVEKMKPDYSVVVQQLTEEVDDYILEIKSRKDGCIIKKSPSELSKDKSLLSKINPVEANRIGYLAGVKETVVEFKMKSNNKG